MLRIRFRIARRLRAPNLQLVEEMNPTHCPHLIAFRVGIVAEIECACEHSLEALGESTIMLTIQR